MFKAGNDRLAQEYFSSINSMAKRIMMDAASFQAKVGVENWQKMPYDAQCEYIRKEFLKSSVVDVPLQEVDVDCFPKLKLISGEKFIVDETDAGNSKKSGYTWRDEHSGPFMWETQSQLDLRLPDDASQVTESVSTPKKKTPPLPAKKGRSSPQIASNSAKTGNKAPAVEKVVVIPEIAKETKPKKPKELRVPIASAVPIVPVAPVVPAARKKPQSRPTSEEAEQAIPKNKNAPAACELASPSEIPKTGFDFLDNW